MENCFQLDSFGTNLYNNAIDLIAENHLFEAIELLMQALEMEDENELYLNTMGLCMYIRGSFEEAKSCWLKSVSIASNSSNAQTYLENMDNSILTQYISGFNTCVGNIENCRLISALTNLLPVLEKVPNVHGFNLAGLLSYSIGLKKTALRFWKKSLSLDLTDKTAVSYINSCRLGFIPFIIEKTISEVFLLAGKLKLL